MTASHEHDPTPAASTTSAVSSSPARRRTPASRVALFALFTVTLVVLFTAAGLTAFNLRWIREWVQLRRILHRRAHYLTMATYPDVAIPERRDHLRACYKNPGQVDFDKISWDLYSRPTPFLGYAPEPGEQGEGRFNAQQLRNRNDVVLPKPPGVYRIFLTGGSQAYSVGAPSQDESIPAYLERMLNQRNFAPGRRVEVFNAAVCGWASSHERIFMENRAAAWEPDLVITLTGGNDAHWAHAGYDINDVRTYEDDLYFASINAAMRWAGAREYPPEPPSRRPQSLPPDVVAARFVTNVRLAAIALQPSGARLVVALQPTLSPAAKPLTAGESLWLKKFEADGKVEYVEQCFAAIADALGAPGKGRNVLDHNPENLRAVSIRDVFAKREDAIFFDLFHMADKGNELVATRLADELARLGP